MSNLPSSASEAQMIDLFQNFKMPVMGAGGGFAPIGTINFFDASIAPQGWLACDGSVVNIADYPELATYYASVHGSTNFYGGDGTTTFAVPDLRGEFLRGTGTNSHENQGSGANVGVHQDGTEIMAVKNNPNNNIPTGFFSLSDDNNYRNADATKSESYNFIDYRNNTGGAESGTNTFTSRPTNTSFLICVKATLSDAHLDSYKIYSPNEHQVGWWQEEIDGVLKQKKVYEKTVTSTTTSTNTTYGNIGNTSTLIGASIERVINIQTQVTGDAIGTGTACSANCYPDGLYVGQRSTSSNVSFTADCVIRYTKTTDQWQVV